MVENNVVHDTLYTGAQCGRHLSDVVVGVKVDHNTVYNSGRDGILTPVAHATITYNTIHDVGLQTTEAGGIYTVNINGQGSVMAYNTVYNIHTGGYGGTALFPDNNSSGWSIHNNLTYNVDYAFKLNYTSNNNQIYNNTLGATKMSINTNQIGNWDGVKIYNNIFEAPVLITPGATLSNNATSLSSANSSSRAARQLQLGRQRRRRCAVAAPSVATPPVRRPHRHRPPGHHSSLPRPQDDGSRITPANLERQGRQLRRHRIRLQQRLALVQTRLRRRSDEVHRRYRRHQRRRQHRNPHRQPHRDAGRNAESGHRHRQSGTSTPAESTAVTKIDRRADRSTWSSPGGTGVANITSLTFA